MILPARVPNTRMKAGDRIRYRRQEYDIEYIDMQKYALVARHVKTHKTRTIRMVDLALYHDRHTKP